MILNIGLTVLVVSLIVQNRELKKSVAIFPQEGTRALGAGDSVGSITLRTFDGRDVEVGDQNATHLLFVFTTTCQYCEKNWSNWINLSSLCDGMTVQAVGVSLHPLEITRQFVEAKKPGFRICMGDSTFSRAYRIRGVPTTILVHEGGRIEGVWIGQLDDKFGEIVNKLATSARLL